MSRATEAAALALGVALGAVGTKEVLDVKPPQAVERPGEERLVFVEGAKKYVRPMTLTDGGEVLLLVDTPSCKRSPRKDAQCMWSTDTALFGPPVMAFVDPGVNNRHPAAEMVGAECEPVACAVMAGEDADAAETDKAPAIEELKP